MPVKPSPPCLSFRRFGVYALPSSLTGAEKAVGRSFRVVGGHIAGPNLLVCMQKAVKSFKVTPLSVDDPQTSLPSCVVNRQDAPDDKAPQSLEEFDGNLDFGGFQALLRDYLPNPKAPERLKNWIRELPYRESKLK